MAQIIDGLHAASAAVWVGGLLVLATSARPLFLTGYDRAYALETAERLSRLAGLALLCVVLTGIYNAVTAAPGIAWRHTPCPRGRGLDSPG